MSEPVGTTHAPAGEPTANERRAATGNYRSWGRYPRATHRHVEHVTWPDDAPFEGIPGGMTALPYGRGRSYGDSCLNDGGALVDTSALDRLVHFDPDAGVVRCEAGLTIGQLLEVIVPRGWFVPVTPGTRHVTIAGAVANDIHGKNHHVAGTFGRHVRSIDLVRSDRGRLRCSPDENADLFGATIGGLGLTGVITHVEFSLRKLDSPEIDVERIRFPTIDGFFAIDDDTGDRFEHSVAWVDLMARGASLGRGVYFRGTHAPARATAWAPRTEERTPLPVPIDAPGALLGRLTMRAYNLAYYARAGTWKRTVRQRYGPFFYPLDGLDGWNRLYGKRGFLQWQCVVGGDDGGRTAMRGILSRIADSRVTACLGVLKRFGDVPSPGWLSFPRPGLTLAADFPNDGPRTFELLDRLDAIVAENDGAIYPAKDARMSAGHFRGFFPRWQELAAVRDPRLSSSLWRRVTGDPA